MLGILTHYATGILRWFGPRSGDAARLGPIMVLGHTAFGIGIRFAAPRFAEPKSRP
jgi:hypothetical protein